MDLTFDEVREMNMVQKQIFESFIDICSQLGLTYYMIHGSLLGTLRCKGFFPYDDDIDVAMPREDYNCLLKNGPTLFPKNMFLQSCETEKEYPMVFAKIRNSETAFVQTIMKNYSINQGIYIDIFPIDNYPKNVIQRKCTTIREQLYKIRVNSRGFRSEKQPLWKGVVRAISKLLCPSWNKAVRKRAELYANIPENGKVITVGGKDKERGIPKAWFGEGRKLLFEGIEVNCPKELEKYLACIYGDYEKYNPAKEYMTLDGKVTVSAEIFSTTKSYKDYKY